MSKAFPSGLPELAVIGWPLHQTFSPVMQNAALRHVGLDWRYAAIPVAPEDLPGFVHRVAPAMKGFNVTIPLKEAVAGRCATLDALSTVSGAVNTVRCSTRDAAVNLDGHNTDGPGLLTSLSTRGRFDPAGARVLIIGAGGAAAGCAAALAQSGAAQVIFLNRNADRSAALESRMASAFAGTAWSHEAADPLPSAVQRLASARFDLVINCVPEEPASGLVPLLDAVRGEHPVFCDLSYSASPGALLLGARSAGYRVVPGLEILLWQGVYAFEILTGLSAPVQVMRDAVTTVVGEWWLEC